MGVDAVPDDGHNGNGLGGPGGVVIFQRGLEHIKDDGQRTGSAAGGDDEAEKRAGGGLGGDHDLGGAAGGIAEDAVDEGGDLGEGAVVVRGEAEAVNHGDGLGCAVVVAGVCLVDEGALLLRLEHVLDAQRDFRVTQGADHAWMQDTRPEVGHFADFFVGEHRDDTGVVHVAGVGGHHAVHVGPEPDLVGPGADADDGGGVVGAAAPECGELAVWGGPDVAGNHGDDVAVQHGEEVGGDLLATGGHVWDGVAEGVVGSNEGVGVDGDGADGVLADEGGDNTGGEALPDAGHAVEGLGR